MAATDADRPPLPQFPPALDRSSGVVPGHLHAVRGGAVARVSMLVTGASPLRRGSRQSHPPCEPIDVRIHYPLPSRTREVKGEPGTGVNRAASTSSSQLPTP